ncbi:MAG: ArnT family glycosyltransferase, partial [Anaerolineales bacterium]
VINALHGRLEFDEADFLYPSFPKYTMFGLGKLVLALGYGDWEVSWAARLLSVILGAGVVVLTYSIARLSGVTVGFSVLAALLVFTNSVLAQNARFAHNDIYLTLFVLLATWASLRYAQTEQRGWFYLGCFMVGLAASSKYNGIALLLLPLALFFIFTTRKQPSRDQLSQVETLILGLILTGLGYALGTPKALLWMTFYFKRMIPAFLNQASYGLRPDSIPGFMGQWGLLTSVLSTPVVVLALIAFAYALYRLVQVSQNKGWGNSTPRLVLPMAIIAIDLPIMLSYNYVARYFLPLLPLLAVLIGQLAEHLNDWLRKQGWRLGRSILVSGLAGVLVYSFLRVIGVMLLFENDARRSASEFLDQLPAASSAEYTFYPPNINREIFTRAYTYPLFFVKWPGETPPTDQRFEYNTGATGVADRQPDYLIIDSFTYERFQDPFICESILAECEFFTDLLAGKTDYVLIGNFEYDLPAWMPAMPRSFLNPDIRVYQRGIP